MTLRHPLLWTVLGLSTLFSFAPLAAAADLDLPARDAVTGELFMTPPAGNASVTRIDFTMAVTRSLYGRQKRSRCFANLAPSLPVSYTRLFRDVANTSSYAKELCVAMHVGIVSGDADGNFRPFDPITMAEASKILAKAYGLTYPPKNAPTRTWYWSSMEALRQRGAITTSTRPTALLTVDEQIVMFSTLGGTERFPASRIIGTKPAPIPVATLPTDTAIRSTLCAVTCTVPAEPEKRAERRSRRALLRELKAAGRL